MRTSRKSGPFFRTFSRFAPVFRALPRFFPVFYLVMYLFSWYHYTYKTTAKSTPFRDLYRIAETTHTPQGDGNSARLAKPYTAKRNNPHPARGRNLSFECACNLRFVKIPRKGTETPPCMCRTLSTNRNTPYPVRGRKQRQFKRHAKISGNNSHPARGRKPVRPNNTVRNKGNNSHPARGRKHAVVVRVQRHAHETTHTPQGDGNP